MDAIFLCGYFDKSKEEEIQTKTKTWVENAANLFQQRLIAGLNSFYEMHILSAPFIPSWPKGYKDFYYWERSVSNSTQTIEYVSFNNIWGYRNISRRHSLIKTIKTHLQLLTGEKVIFVYSSHTPLLEAAVYAKKKNKDIRICLIVPDLPEYMNLSKGHRKLYDFFKKYDIRRFSHLCKAVDSFVLLTEHMAEKLHVDNRPYIVIEGIADTSVRQDPHPRGKRIAYAGKLLESFGVKRLIDAFLKISDPEAQLDICGGGELNEYVKSCAEIDNRIHYHGVVLAEEASRILGSADVLVNPRLNDDEYTKYSFPSKNIEYLLTGNAVIGYLLDGMPLVYREFMIIPENDTVHALKEAIENAFNETNQSRDARKKKALIYLNNNCTPFETAKKMYMLNQK